ncbi:hypothetical protein V501_00487, partial [Pseudogymnoascus sp. VKM F-4519 (FW-2642)]
MQQIQPAEKSILSPADQAYPARPLRSTVQVGPVTGITLLWLAQPSVWCAMDESNSEP